MPTYVFSSNATPKVAHSQVDVATAPVRVAECICRRAGVDHNIFSGTGRIATATTTVRVAYGNYPDFSWIGETMFLDGVIFPTDISYDSEGAEVFSTDVNTSVNGFTQRVALWDQPLMEYNVAYGVRTMEQLEALKALFRVVRGQSHAFRFRDPIDYTSSYAVGEEARAPDAITAFDQWIADGDGQIEAFQLRKAYSAGARTTYRKITRPERGSVQIGIGGVKLPSSRYSVDFTTGIVTLTENDRTTLVGARMIRGAGSTRTIVWTTTEGSLTVVEGDFVQISGFDAANNRVNEANAFEVVLIDTENKTIVFRVPDEANAALGVNETMAVDALSYLTPAVAPPLGKPITAGFRFHVPVRFQTDRLPVSLEAYGIGSASEVKLIEVRGEE